ncbi:hypothetical protein DU000_01550 [Parvibium lacunae]|uniref:Uncharacterized protein n=1 Tax=Parvibium lacunae TaxID=1888893 RepID=A0A368L7A1_9BURK|nr:hypothetical protein DU000_01550 [Parvibium lacunae]
MEIAWGGALFVRRAIEFDTETIGVKQKRLFDFYNPDNRSTEPARIQGIAGKRVDTVLGGQ